MSDQTAGILGKPKYIQSSFSLFLPVQSSVASLSAQLSEALGSLYQPAEILKVPNEADPEIPRLVFVSQHGFSQIVASLSSVVLTVQYSPNWQNDVSLGEQYLRERVEKLAQALDATMFLGMATVVQYPVQDEDQLIAALAKHHGTTLSKGTPHEIVVKLSSVIDQTYFSNLTIRNYRTWSVAPYYRGVFRLSKENQTEQGLEVAIDFNDRYAFNERVDYKSSPAIALNVLDLGFRELRSNLDSLEQRTWT